MKTRTARLLCAVMVGLTLLYLYLSFLSSFFSNPGLYPQTSVEIVVVFAQVAKVAAILSSRRLRFAGSVTIWVIFALETLTIPVITAAFFITGDRGYLDLFRQIFSVWPAALLLIAPPYLILRFSAEMFTRVDLKRTLPSAVLEFSFLAFIANLFLTGAGTITSIEGVTGLLFSGLRGAIPGGRGVLPPNSLLTVPSIALYLALIVYVALPRENASNFDVPTILLLPLLSTAGLLLWVLFAAVFVPNAIVSLTIPSALLAAFIWLIGRGR